MSQIEKRELNLVELFFKDLLKHLVRVDDFR